MHQTRIDSDHPALPGHFPGAPVVPGAVILSRVLAAARDRCPDRVVTGLGKVKFLQSVVPDQGLDIEIQAPSTERVSFVCRQNETVCVRGRLLLRTTA